MSDWKPRYKVQKAAGVVGPPIPDDEPCLVIRAQDELATDILEHYMRLYSLQPGGEGVRLRLQSHYNALVKWRENNRDKIKRAD